MTNAFRISPTLDARDARLEPVVLRDQFFSTEAFWRLARIEGLRRAGLSKTISAYSVLELLLGSPEECSSLSQISQLLGVSRSNLTHVVTELVKDGVVEREQRRQSPDHRVIKITLTPAGREIAEQVRPVEAAVAKALTDCLSDEEQRILLQYLGRMSASARSLLPDAFEWKRR
jgi:DNA-binding MarR family transcriptional regulator